MSRATDHEVHHAYSERLDQALVLAAAVHKEQFRKGTPVPYIIHPYQVALILDRHGWPEDVVVAGALHDVLEDARCEQPEFRARIRNLCPDLIGAPENDTGFRKALGDHISRHFGAGVLEIVEHVTEVKKSENGERRPWKTRKLEQLETMKAASAEVVALKAADVLHNARSIARDLRASGTSVMTRYNAPPHEVLWYYRTTAELVAERLGGADPLARELQLVAGELEAALPSAR